MRKRNTKRFTQYINFGMRRRRKGMNGRSYITGFTLVEVLVGMSVFLVAATIISSIFVRAVQTQRQANEIMVATSDAGLMLERIAREIRQGYDFQIVGGWGSCTPTPPASSPTASGEVVCFNRAAAGGNPITVGYGLNGSDVERSEDDSGGNATLLTSGSADYYGQLNSNGTSIEKLDFILTQPATTGNNNPWRITIVMWVKPSDAQNAYTEELQTTVEARILPEEASPPSS